MENIMHELSWKICSSDMEAYITQTGGMVGPVTFDRRGRNIQPFHVAPWAGRKDANPMPPILRALRGDFFCMPFGDGNDTGPGEKHPLHGESANRNWELVEQSKLEIHLRMPLKVRHGLLEKHISLREGHPAVYSRHVISGMSGKMCFGHHAMLAFPDYEGSGVLSTSPIQFGIVHPSFENAATGGYSALKAGASFKKLTQAPLATGGFADLTRYPARRGYEDLVQLATASTPPFAWTAVTFPKEKFVWFALKNPRVLRHTVLWMSNGGRHYAPWNSRHINVMGIEEVTACFNKGLATSTASNVFSRRGAPTCVRLAPQQPLEIRYVMAVTAIPAGFDRVARIEPSPNGQGLVLHANQGKKVSVAVDSTFVTA